MRLGKLWNSSLHNGWARVSAYKIQVSVSIPVKVLVGDLDAISLSHHGY